MPQKKAIQEIADLQVWADGRQAGTLAILPDHRIAFEYTKGWLENGFSISPLSLPLKPGVFIPKSYDPFEGLFGVFADSLPDGWGALLVDRRLRSLGIRYSSLNALQKLALTGSQGRGLLEYRPSVLLKESFTDLDFDQLASECEKILADKPSDHLDTLFELGGSSGGARPKINASFQDAEWIIKFPASMDPRDIGLEEYQYFECAKECGIEVPSFALFPSQTSPGYFGCQRFDRTGDQKVHMISVSALLETSHRIPNLDYEDLLKLTWIVCRDADEVEKMFRLACFNVFSHNRDDHSKNFSFLYRNGAWHLSPAYDLTWSESIGGEHATTVHGNGRNPGVRELQAAADSASISPQRANAVITEVSAAVQSMLKEIFRRHEQF